MQVRNKWTCRMSDFLHMNFPTLVLPFEREVLCDFYDGCSYSKFSLIIKYFRLTDRARVSKVGEILFLLKRRAG